MRSAHYGSGPARHAGAIDSFTGPERAVSGNRFLLDPRSLSAKVSPATFERGLSVYRNQQVLDADLLIIMDGTSGLQVILIHSLGFGIENGHSL